MSLYQYRVHEVLRVIDGDSFEFIVDLGFHTHMHIRVRLLGADTYELRGGDEDTKSLARQGRQFSEEFFNASDEVYVRTDSVDSFGRWLGEIWNDKGHYLCSLLSEAGLTTGRYE